MPGRTLSAVDSKLENVPLEPWETYFIVIDGSHGESGDYGVHVDETWGACCLDSGECEVMPESQCLGTWWYNDGLGCTPSLCPVPGVGACCCRNGSCRILDPEHCAFLRGSYVGEGTVCEPSPCVSRSTPQDEGETRVIESHWGAIKSRYSR